jgi:hypothetical protein
MGTALFFGRNFWDTILAVMKEVGVGGLKSPLFSRRI